MKHIYSSTVYDIILNWKQCKTCVSLTTLFIWLLFQLDLEWYSSSIPNNYLSMVFPLIHGYFFINICITTKWNNPNNNFVTSSKKQIFEYYLWKETFARYKTVKQAESSTKKMFKREMTWMGEGRELGCVLGTNNIWRRGEGTRLCFRDK